MNQAYSKSKRIILNVFDLLCRKMLENKNLSTFFTMINLHHHHHCHHRHLHLHNTLVFCTSSWLLPPHFTIREDFNIRMFILLKSSGYRQGKL